MSEDSKLEICVKCGKPIFSCGDNLVTRNYSNSGLSLNFTVGTITHVECGQSYFVKKVVSGTVSSFYTIPDNQLGTIS